MKLKVFFFWFTFKRTDIISTNSVWNSGRVSSSVFLYPAKDLGLAWGWVSLTDTIKETEATQPGLLRQPGVVAESFARCCLLWHKHTAHRRIYSASQRWEWSILNLWHISVLIQQSNAVFLYVYAYVYSILADAFIQWHNYLILQFSIDLCTYACADNVAWTIRCKTSWFSHCSSRDSS